MGTTIQITPPGGATDTIGAYDTCTTKRASANAAGSFKLQLPDLRGLLLDKYVFGSDVAITQDGHVFRGWVMDSGKSLNGQKRTISLSGADYKVKTQKIVVTESYVEKTIGFIVDDLFSAYVPWATRSNINECSQVISIKFNDKFLWDAMEQLHDISGFDWDIDANLDVHFFQPESRISEYPIIPNSFKRGSASLTPDYSKLVNRLWVKGGKALSEDCTQAITVGSTPIPLLYTPRATTDGVVITIDGAPKTLGIQHLHEPGEFDFLLNYAEKLLVPDLATPGSGSIVYRYEYPIKLLLEDPDSQAAYGVYEDILPVDTDERETALEIGLRYLAKYSQPVVTGSISPFAGVYRPGEMVQITIPNLNVDGYLQIQSVEYDSINLLAKVDRTLHIESPERDIQSIMKALNRRITRLEKQVYQDDDGPIERYIARSETTAWGEEVTLCRSKVHYCSDTLFVSPTLY